MKRTLVIDGQSIEATYLGHGLFCKAYRHGETVFVLCDGDYSKECIALFVDKGLRHIPQITRHEDFKGYQVFSMPFYRRVTKKHTPEAYRLWRRLPHVVGGLGEIEQLIRHLRDLEELSLVEALQELFDQFCNYADPENIIMEFQKFNVGVDQHGELILRDCLADSVSISTKRKQHRKEAS